MENIIAIFYVNLLLLYSLQDNNKIIKSVYMEHNKMSICYTDSSLRQDLETLNLKIYKSKQYKYVHHNGVDIYLNPDTAAAFVGDICPELTKDFVDTSALFKHNPNVVITLFIDSSGNVFEGGFQRQDYEMYYNFQALKAIVNISEKKFTPALIEGTAVASIFNIAVFYSNQSCIQIE